MNNTRETMTLYFHAIRTVDILLFIGISQGFRKVNGNIKCVLLITQYPQFSYDGLSLNSYFEKVFYLPYCDYHHNIVKGYIERRKHYRILAEIGFEDKSAFFYFDNTELANLNIRRYLAEIKYKVAVKSIYLTYVIGPLNYKILNKTKLLLKRSVFGSLYTLALFHKLILYKYYRKKSIFYRFTWPPDVYKEVYINCKSPAGFDPEFENMSLPFVNMELSMTDKGLDLKMNAIIVLLDDFRAYYESPADWEIAVGALLQRFREQFAGYNLYLKLHPTDNLENYGNIDFQGFEIIEQRDMLEKTIIFNKSRIMALYSYCSSANFAACSLGLPSFHLYPLLPLEDDQKEYWDKLFSANSYAIAKINELSQINKNNLTIRPAASGEKDSKDWVRLYDYLRQ